MIIKKINTLSISFIGVLFTLNAIASNNSPNHKLKRAAQGKAILNQYIVILKNELLDEEINQEFNSLAKPTTPSNKKAIKRQKIAHISADMEKKYKANIRHQYHSKLYGFAITMNEQQLNALLEDERVDYVEEDSIVNIDITQEDVTWGIDRIDQENLPLDDQYTYQYTGNGVTAYIIDTGIQSTHSEFADRVGTGKDYINDGYGTDDCNGHGTHVAGTVGGETYGVAKDVTLIPVRVLDCSGYGATSDIIASLSWVLDNATQPAVVNMSLGSSSSPSQTYITALTELVDSGIPVIVSAGNSPSIDSCNRSPSGIPAAITVAATDFFSTSDMQATFSSYGQCVDIYAPGDTIKSASIYGGYTQKSGTSMSAPHVTGVVALYLQSNPNANRYQVESVIEANAVADLIQDVEDTPNLLVQTVFLSLPSSNATLNINSAIDWGDEVLTYAADNTIDGSLEWASRWETSGSPVHLELDLGEAEYVTGVGISWGKGAEMTYNFEVWARESSSDDWTKVRERNDSTGSTSSIESYDVSSINARYVRVKTHSNSIASDLTIIKEVEVYGVNDDAKISSAFDDGTSHNAYPATNAIDGSIDRATRWAAYDETSVNLTIELQEISYVTHVAIAWDNGDQYTYTFEIYARADTSGDWVKVFDDLSDGQTDGFEVFDITDINAQQIRIKSFGSTDNTNWTNINEVQVYGAVNRN